MTLIHIIGSINFITVLMLTIKRDILLSITHLVCKALTLEIGFSAVKFLSRCLLQSDLDQRIQEKYI
jgi:hypothetical protein